MKDPVVTAILLSYKRKPNIPPIIEALRSQTVEVEIWLINNDGFENFGADRFVAIPWNAGEWARYIFARRISTEYGMFQDDDFMLGDPNFLEDAIAIHKEKCPRTLLGVAGRGLNTEFPYYQPDIINTSAYASILKGHFQLWRKDSLSNLHVPYHPSASDISWSLDIGRGKRVHWVDKGLADRLVTLDRHGVGYEFRKYHYREREDACGAYLDEYGADV